MPLRSDLAINGRNAALLAETTITTAVTASLSSVITGIGGMKYLAVQALFDYGSGGTTAKFYVQTSFDKGTTWTDIMCFSFTTSDATKFQVVKAPTAVSANQSIQDAALTANTILDGVLGDRLRIKYTTTGTYAAGGTPSSGTTIKIDAVVKG